MYFTQPAYFSDFRCIGGDCKFTCCQDWRIDLTEEEVEKMKSVPNCSDELRAILEKSSIKINDKYTILFGKDHKCQLLTEDGFCRVQREIGVEYLPNICIVYPRKYRGILDINKSSYQKIHRSCRISCIEVCRRVLTDKKAMNLVNVNIPEKEVKDVRIDSEEDYRKHPELVYRDVIFNLFYELISDKKYSAETAIIHGAIAAQILTEIVADKQYDSIPQAVKELRGGFLKGNMFKELDDIKPDYRIKIGFVAGQIEKMVSKSVVNTLRTENGSFSVALYRKGEKVLSEMYSGDDYWLRNIALSLLFEFSMPFNLVDYSIMDNYSFYVIAFAIIKLNAISAMAGTSDGLELEIRDGYCAKFFGEEKLWGFTSLICRDVCQNVDNPKKFIAALKDAKLTTPGQLALLIK